MQQPIGVNVDCTACAYAAHLGAHAACVTVRLHAERPCVRIQIQLLGYSLDRAWLTRRHANERESGATYGGRAREIFLVLASPWGRNPAGAGDHTLQCKTLWVHTWHGHTDLSRSDVHALGERGQLCPRSLADGC